MGITFLTTHPGNMVVEHHAGAGELMHQNLPDYLLIGFAVSWTRLAPKGSVVRG
jgi:hypothetical protein